MKKLILFFFVFMSFKAKGQLYLLGKTESQIDENFIHLDYIQQDKQVKTNGADRVTTLVYVPRNDNDQVLTPKTFILKNNVCVRYIISDDLKGLPNMIDALKDGYKRIDDTHWIDNNARYKSTLLMQEKGFMMVFEKM